MTEDGVERDPPPADPGNPAPSPPGAGPALDRRHAPRALVDVPCTVHAGVHVYDATIRDVSAAGAMLRGVAGLLAGDLLRLRLARLPDRPIVAVVRGVSLIGVHIEILDATERLAWREALQDLIP